MCKLWLGICPTKGAIEQIVQWQRWQPLLATNNMANLHQMVVNDICKVVCWQSVNTLIEHLIIKGRCVYLNIATNKVVHSDSLILWHLEADNPDIATRNTSLYLLGTKAKGCWKGCAHLVVISKGLTTLLVLLAQSIKLLGSIKGVVCPTSLNKLLCILKINLTAL